MPSRYQVNINSDSEAPSAVDDLKGLPPEVSDVLVAVLAHELREVPRADSGDEGRVLIEESTRLWNWRRGIRADDRRRWEENRSPPSEAVRLASEYIIVYAYLLKAEARLCGLAMPTDYPGFFVWRIFHNRDLSPAVAAKVGRPD